MFDFAGEIGRGLIGLVSALAAGFAQQAHRKVSDNAETIEELRRQQELTNVLLARGGPPPSAYELWLWRLQYRRSRPN